jgi:protocatechuate 3,4-dioxygenase alpha subunit
MSGGGVSGRAGPDVGLLPTPSQTAGPFLHIGMLWPDGPMVVDEDAPGAIWIGGRIVDGAGEAVTDALVETWQADAEGRFASSEDPRGAVTDFRGWGRCETDDHGRWRICTVKPGPVPGPDGSTQAPHLDLTIHARGLLRHLLTRVYFADEADANNADPVLTSLSSENARSSLLATPVEGEGEGQRAGGRGTRGGYTIDIRLQGDDATVFFEA